MFQTCGCALTCFTSIQFTHTKMITYLLICQPIRKQSNVILLSVCCNGNFGYANSVCQIKVYIKKKKQVVAISKLLGIIVPTLQIPDRVVGSVVQIWFNYGCAISVKSGREIWLLGGWDTPGRILSLKR